jgi:hypothetical protein
MNLYCDTHVHCYDLLSFSSLLDQAHRNFSSAAGINSSTANQNTEPRFLMFFTDGVKDKTWAHIHPQAVAKKQLGDWQLSLARDDKLIRASNGEKLITLAPARQINSSQRLEFLLLGCDKDIADGITEQKIIDSYADQYLLICPWGFGKWLGKRAKVLRELLSINSSRLFLGDNGGRPGLWHHVPHFRQARLPIINGSDPLPLTTDTRRIGSFGIHWLSAESELTLAELLEEIKTATPQNYGPQLSLYRFVRNQIALKLKPKA